MKISVLQNADYQLSNFFSSREEFQPWNPDIQDDSIDSRECYDLMILLGVSIVFRSFCRWVIWYEFGVLWLP